MKARWFIISPLLALLFAFAFFLSEARLGKKRETHGVLAVPPAAPVAGHPYSAENRVAERDDNSVSKIENPFPRQPKPADEQTVELARPSVISAKPVLVEGSVSQEDGSLIYEADAKLRLASDIILSSPTGVMVSNEKQTLFAGDMQIEAGKNTITAHEGVLNTTTNQMTAAVASISFTNENNQLVRMTGENVTLELPSRAPSAPSTASATQQPNAVQ